MSLYRQPPVWSYLDLRAILSGISSAWLGGGAAARADLRASLESSHHSLNVLLTDSGTSALTLALQAIGEVTAAPVALPAYSCYDVATAADGAGVPFLLYDLDPSTLSPDLPSLRRAFAGGARSVVVAHLYGVPADLAAVGRLAREFEAMVIEDAAQGAGCSWEGRPAGAHGSLGVLSFGRGKGVTGGAGGALLVHEPRLAEPVLHAWDRARGPRTPRGGPGDLARLVAQWLLARPSLYAIPASLPFLGLGETRYRPPREVGGMSLFGAGVVRRTIQASATESAARRLVAERLRRALGSHAQITPAPGWTAGWLRFPLVAQRTADGVLPRELVQAGVARGYPGTLAQLPGFGSRRQNLEDKFPNAELLAERLVTLPTHRHAQDAKVPAFWGA